MPRVKKSTNVLETIRKAPLAENKTALKKKQKNTFCGITHYRHSVTNCFLTQNFTEIVQYGAQLWPKTIFKMADIRHLEFGKFSYLVIWLSSSSKCAVV